MPIDFKEMNRRYELYGPKMEDIGVASKFANPYKSMTYDSIRLELIRTSKELGKAYWYMEDMKKMFNIYFDNAEFEIAELKKQLKK